MRTHQIRCRYNITWILVMFYSVFLMRFSIFSPFFSLYRSFTLSIYRNYCSWFFVFFCSLVFRKRFHSLFIFSVRFVVHTYTLTDSHWMKTGQIPTREGKENEQYVRQLGRYQCVDPQRWNGSADLIK